MRRFISNALPLAVAIQLLAPTPARGQLTEVNGLGDAILNLHREVSGNQQHVFDNLFSGRIDATIIDSDRNTTNFADGDIVAFSLASTRTRSGIAPLVFSGTRTAFDDFVEQNAQQVLAILFPASLTESVTGIDVAQHHSQQFLVSTVLASGRGDIGGRLEFESFDVDQSSGDAIQGLFRWNIVAFEGRYAKLHDTANTKSFSSGINAHPYWKHLGQTTEWRVGADGYFNAMISKSAGLDIDALDYGGGPWASFRKDFSRITTTLGGIVLGSDTHIPSLDDELQFLADAVNERALRWDMTLGGAVEGRLTNSVALGGQVLHSEPLKSEDDSGRSSQLFLVDFIYRLSSGSKLDFGYRFSTGADQYQAHAVFMNANFAFD